MHSTQAVQVNGDSPRSELKAAWLLLGGALLIFLSFMRFGIGELGWIAYAPLLVFLHRRGSLKAHLALLGVLLVAMHLTIAKMVTSELSFAAVPMFAIPGALASFLALSLSGAAHRRLGAHWGVYTFASLSVVAGWAQYTFSPGSSWGALAHTQLDNAPLLQLSALTGLGGLSFLVALGSALTAAVWTSGYRTVRRDVLAFGLLLVGALVYGQLRLASPAPGPSLLVGSVVSPVTHADFRSAMSDIDSLRRHDDVLFARTAQAADLGARAIVWNEAATLVTEGGEEALLARARAFAKERGVLLMVAYGTALSLQPFHWRNQYRVFLPDGSEADHYLKRHPVPGDGDEQGKVHARVFPFEGVQLTGAICYDYGFPGIARDNARDGAGLVLLPSSDWRGIDPQHGRMAMLNATAVGVSMVRPVRRAVSVAVDQYGRTLGALASDGGNDGVMVTRVPGGRVQTLYASTGEVVPLAALAFSVLAILRMLWRRRSAGASAAGRGAGSDESLLAPPLRS